MNEIIVRKEGSGDFSITTEGRTRFGFVSLADCKEWIGAMKAHGLFLGYRAYTEGEDGKLKEIEPTYDNPFATPGFVLFD